MSKVKIGMYGETPRVKIGNLAICMASDAEGEDSVWIEDASGDGGSFKSHLFEKVLQDRFNELF